MQSQNVYKYGSFKKCPELFLNTVKPCQQMKYRIENMNWVSQTTACQKWRPELQK